MLVAWPCNYRDGVKIEEVPPQDAFSSSLCPPSRAWAALFAVCPVRWPGIAAALPLRSGVGDAKIGAGETSSVLRPDAAAFRDRAPSGRWVPARGIEERWPPGAALAPSHLPRRGAVFVAGGQSGLRVGDEQVPCHGPLWVQPRCHPAQPEPCGKPNQHLGSTEKPLGCCGIQCQFRHGALQTACCCECGRTDLGYTQRGLLVLVTQCNQTLVGSGAVCAGASTQKSP